MDEHISTTADAQSAAELAADFALLPAEYQTVIRLAQDRYHISITPLQALTGGRSRAIVYLVNVSYHEPDRLEHLVLKLDHRNEKAQADETRRLEAARRLSPPGFAAQHLAQMAFEPVEVNGVLGIFYALAGQSLHRYRTIGTYEEQSQVEAILANAYQCLLSDWNAARTFQHVTHPTVLLEQWLGYRLKPGGHIDRFLETVCHVPPAIAGFLIRGRIFPNPVAYARTPTWWGSVRPLDALVGLQHGDLNTNNMLVKLATGAAAVENYYLIDFALFKEQMPLCFDLRYLEMSYVLLRQAELSFAKVSDLVAHLGEEDMLDTHQVPVDVAGLCGVIGATRRAYARWIDEHHASLHDDLWGQFWLAGVAAGLSYCNKPGMGDEQRMTGLVYAAANLKRFAALFGVPAPSEGRQIFDGMQTGPRTPAGSPSPVTSAGPQSNLPAQATAFVGREAELASLMALLSDGQHRLVTLVAPGGMGKTRLALEAAGQLQNAFPQGVYFIALDRINSADAIVQAVAEVLPISLSSKEDPRSRVIGYLQDKASLLVMDNFEHVLDGAVLVQAILGSAPRVQVLATSRVKLNLMSESLFHLDGLLIEEVSPRTNSAIQLFVQSAGRARPGFELTSENLPAMTRICRMVGGMPLAIVLAAAWVDTLSLDEIADEIENCGDILETDVRDVSNRQRSVRAVIDWSWNQLDVTAQVPLQRLAVFRGGFTRAAAVEAAGASLRVLAHLVDKALLRRDPKTGRYYMHEMLRQYAEEQLMLSADLEASAHEAHARYVAKFMQTYGTQTHDHRLNETLLAIEADIDNIRTAWAYWTEKRDARALTAFAEAMWIFFEIRGSFTPAVQFFGDAARKLAGDELDIVCARAELQTRQAWFTALIGLPEEGLVLAQESVSTLSRYQDGDVAVSPLNGVTINAVFLNRADIVAQTAQDMLGRAERSGDAWERGWALIWSGHALQLMQRLDEATRAAQDALAIFEQLDNPCGVSVAAGIVLGFITMAREDTSAAKEYLLRGVKAAEAIGYLRLLQITHDGLGTLALLEGDTEQARWFFLKSLRFSQESGQTREMLASLRDLAKVSMSLGDLEGALQLLAVVLHHPAGEQHSLNRPERLRDEAEQLRVVIEATLDQARYRSAWEAGQGRRLAGVVAQVLQ